MKRKSTQSFQTKYQKLMCNYSKLNIFSHRISLYFYSFILIRMEISLISSGHFKCSLMIFIYLFFAIEYKESQYSVKTHFLKGILDYLAVWPKCIFFCEIFQIFPLFFILYEFFSDIIFQTFFFSLENISLNFNMSLHIYVSCTGNFYLVILTTITDGITSECSD